MTSSANHRDRGALSIVAVLLTVMVLAAAGLVVDGGRALSARRHAAGTAEAAARFAISNQSLTTGFDPARARALALDHALRAGVRSGDVAVEVVYRSDGRPEVVVTIVERPRAVFAALLGARSLTVRAEGSAVFVYSP